MSLWEVTAPTVEPVTLTEAKAHARVSDTSEDTWITSQITTAREWAETYTGRAFLTQTWDLKLDGFPACIELPKPPAISVTSITYIDTAGNSQVMSSADYTTSLPTGPYASPGYIVPVYGGTWPSIRSVPDAVIVRFVAGYGATAAAVPAMIKHAVQVRIATMLDPLRESAVVGQPASRRGHH